MTQIISHGKIPVQEVQISEALIIELLENINVGVRSLRLLGEGYDNMIFLINDSYLIRLPRRQVADQLIQNEQAFLKKHGKSLRIAVPKVLHAGKPGDTYPFHWSITNFLLGETAANEKPNSGEVEKFALFLKDLHSLENKGMSHNPHRSTPLTNRVEDMASKMSELKSSTELITPAIENIWAEALTEPRVEQETIIHGDLHGRNILLYNSRFFGIIDWGDVCSGDPATDLASVWMLFQAPEDRQRFFEIYDASSSDIKRAKGWAVFFGVMLTTVGMVNQDSHELIGRFALENLAQ